MEDKLADVRDGVRVPGEDGELREAEEGRGRRQVPGVAQPRRVRHPAGEAVRAEQEQHQSGRRQDRLQEEDGVPRPEHLLPDHTLGRLRLDLLLLRHRRLHQQGHGRPHGDARRGNHRVHCASSEYFISVI